MPGPFVGTIELKYSIKNKTTYLEVKYGNMPYLGHLDHKVKNTYHLSPDIKKLLWMMMHEKGSDQKVIVPDIIEKQKVHCGVLKFKVTKNAKRMFKGWVTENPINAWESLTIKNKFHITRDFQKLDAIRKSDNNGADKAEIETES